MKAIVAERIGGPEVMVLREVSEPQAGPGELLIRVRSAGVNFADASSTLGKYAAAPPPPFIPGLEVAGTAPDGRPVMALVTSGGYAEAVAADRRLVFDAEGLDLADAGGYLLVVLTAYFALAEVARIRPGERVLVTAGAGGLGSAAVQVARALGAGEITAVASTPEKQAFATEHGADRAIGYEDDFPAADVVFDSVGGETFARAYSASPHLGRMVVLGASAGAPPEIPGYAALRLRNVTVSAFSFGALRGADPDQVARLAGPAIEMVRSGAVRPTVATRLPLAQAPEAHRLLTGRRTVGKLVLEP